MSGRPQEGGAGGKGWVLGGGGGGGGGLWRNRHRCASMAFSFPYPFHKVKILRVMHS